MKCKKAIMPLSRILGAGLLFAGLCCAYANAAEGFLTATPDKLDTGIVPEGKTVEVTVSIQNVSGAPIEITSVKTS